MSSQRVYYSTENVGSDRLASIRLDDGKANAMQMEFFHELNRALDRAENDEVSAVVVHGRDGFFSAGLDLKVLPDLSPDALRETTTKFTETMHRVFLFPKPVVAASAGHAIAGGMMLYLAADIRIALDGQDGLYGLNEATTGIPLLAGTAGLCRYGIPPEHHTEMILHGRMVDAAGTHRRRITDDLVERPDQVLPRALERAASLSDLDLYAYALNKRILRERHWQDAVATAAELADRLPTRNFFSRIRR